MDSYAIKNVVDKIKSSTNILLITSEKLDGDSIGSILAMYSVLKKLGKQPVTLTYEPIPPVYGFLPNSQIFEPNVEQLESFIITLANPEVDVDEVKYATSDSGELQIIVTTKNGYYTEEDLQVKGANSKYDLIITFDCGDKKNLGRIYTNHTKMFEETTVINIDHHASNDLFGNINLVDANSSSTAELVYYLIKFLDPRLIDEDVATFLLLGIIADTHNFQNANTSPECLNIAGELVNLGGRQQELIKHLYKTKKLNTLKLWGKILSKLQVDAEHRILWSVITNNDFKSSSTSEEDAQGIIDELMSNAPQTDFIVLLRETKPKKVSASIRTKSKDVDGVYIAKQFGGGGHTQACGFTLEDINISDLEKEVITAIKRYQKERLKKLKHEKAPSEENYKQEIVKAMQKVQEPKTKTPKKEAAMQTGDKDEILAKKLEKDLLG